MPLELYTLPYWSNSPFLIFDIRCSGVWAPEHLMSKIKIGGLDQYGAGPFEQQQCGTASVEGVKYVTKMNLNFVSQYSIDALIANR